MTLIHNLLLLCALVPIVTPQCTVKKTKSQFSRSVFEFSADLLRRINEDTNGHFVCSTFSPYTLLTAVALGATDETLGQITRTLHHPKHKCFYDKYLELSRLALSPDSESTVERSGVLFVDDAIGLNANFRRKLTATRVCEITPLSFSDFSNAAFQINDFVKSTTHGIIDEIVAPADLNGVFLMFVDALYFKGSWRNAFAVENTENSVFFDELNNIQGDVNLMYLNDHFNMTTLKPIQASVLELPYGHNDRFSMLIFLPDEGVSLSTMIGNLKKISFKSIFSQFQRTGPQMITVQIPRFKITSDLANLKELFTDMGLRDMFDPNRAKFPELSDYQLHVSSFVQKADIEVTEEGTVAAAATDMGFSFRSSMADLEFIANKPFLFMVVDREAQIPFFSGAYSQPSLY